MLTYGELKTEAAVLAQRSGDADYVAKIGSWIKFSHSLLAEVYDYWFDLQDTYNFTTVDGQEAYSLPNRFDKPFRLYDLTNKNKITPQTEEEYSEDNLGNIVDATEGVPSKYRIYGTTGVSTPISTSGDTVQVKSSSTSDSGGIVVRIGGYVDSSLLIEDYEDITINTGSPTTYTAGTKTFYKITSASKSDATTGYITIANSSSTALDTLAPQERVSRHKVLRLGLIPDDAYSMRLLFKKTVKPLDDDNDYPFTECDRYLVTDAAGFALAQDKDNARAEQMFKEAERSLKYLLANQNNKLGPDYIQKIVSTWAQAHRL